MGSVEPLLSKIKETTAQRDLPIHISCYWHNETQLSSPFSSFRVFPPCLWALVHVDQFSMNLEPLSAITCSEFLQRFIKPSSSLWLLMWEKRQAIRTYSPTDMFMDDAWNLSSNRNLTWNLNVSEEVQIKMLGLSQDYDISSSVCSLGLLSWASGTTQAPTEEVWKLSFRLYPVSLYGCRKSICLIPFSWASRLVLIFNKKVCPQ